MKQMKLSKAVSSKRTNIVWTRTQVDNNIINVFSSKKLVESYRNLCQVLLLGLKLSSIKFYMDQKAWHIILCRAVEKISIEQLDGPRQTLITKNVAELTKYLINSSWIDK
jgi:hypothetical protein